MDDDMDRLKSSRAEFPSGLKPVERSRLEIFRGKFFVAATDRLRNRETTVLRVRKTEGIGSGLFAKVELPKDSRLFCVQGQEYQCYEDEEAYTANPGEMFPSLAPGALLPNAICTHQEIEQDSARQINTWLNPDDDNPLRFLNHSCDPNTGRLGPYVFVAMRPIPAGAQIVADYSTMEVNPRWSMECQCGSPTCRHQVRSIQSLPLKTIERYWQYLPTFMRKIYLGSLSSRNRTAGQQRIVEKLASDIKDGFF